MLLNFILFIKLTQILLVVELLAMSLNNSVKKQYLYSDTASFCTVSKSPEPHLFPFFMEEGTSIKKELQHKITSNLS